jgi:osmotically-inducible protein OsmY
MMKKSNGLNFAAVTIAALTMLSGCNKPPQASAEVPPPNAAVAQVTDMDVTEHVKTALHQNETLKGYDISVVTLKGDVRLIGTLDSQSQIDEVVRIARASDGVHSVHNELIVKS